MKNFIFITSLLATINLQALSCFGSSNATQDKPAASHIVPQASLDTTTNETGDAFTAVGDPVAAGLESLHATYSHNGAYAAVPNSFSNTVSVFSVNCENGTFTPLQTVDTGNSPFLVDFSPCDTHAIVTNLDFGGSSPTITVYSINPDTGQWSLIQTVEEGLLENTTAISYSPDGRFVLVANNRSGANGAISRFRVSPTSGKLIFIENVAEPNTPSSLAFSPNGRFLAVTTISNSRITIYAVDLITGALTHLDDDATGSIPVGVTFQHDGHFLAFTNLLSNTITVYQVNPVTGSLFNMQSITNPSALPITVSFSRNDEMAAVGSAVLPGQVAVFCVADGIWSTTPVQILPPVLGGQRAVFAPCSDFAAVVDLGDGTTIPGSVQVYQVNESVCQ